MISTSTPTSCREHTSRTSRRLHVQTRNVADMKHLAKRLWCCPEGTPHVSQSTPAEPDIYLRMGDQAGSDASPGVGTRCRLRPVTSMLHSFEPAPGPAS